MQENKRIFFYRTQYSYYHYYTVVHKKWQSVFSSGESLPLLYNKFC